MGFFHNNPAIVRSNIEVKAKAILGRQSGLIDQLIEILGEKGARRVLGAAARLPDKGNRRTNYVRACIFKPKRKKELEAALLEYPDPYEILQPEELREIDQEALKEHLHQRHLIEKELDLLDGGKPGGPMLAARIGRERAIKLTFEVYSVAGERRGEIILRNTARPDIKYPERYVRAALDDVRGEAGQE